MLLRYLAQRARAAHMRQRAYDIRRAARACHARSHYCFRLIFAAMIMPFFLYVMPFIAAIADR